MQSVYANKCHIYVIIFILSLFAMNITEAAQSAVAKSANIIPMQFVTDAPDGAENFCRKSSWACRESFGSGITKESLSHLIKKVNTDINRNVRQTEDIDLYGVREYWTLPGKNGGDCEDFALLKKYTLLQKGVSTKQLFIATALDKSGSNHAVLIVRVGSEDYVLDNKTNAIKLWNKTGYSFLKVQDPSNPRKWRAVLAGGIFQ